MGVAAAHNASALANRARPIREPNSPSLGLSLRKALAIIQLLNCTVGLPPAPISLSSIKGSKLKGCKLPLLIQRDCGDLRCSEGAQEEGVGSGSSNLLSEGPGSDSSLYGSSSGVMIFPSLSEMKSVTKSIATFDENRSYYVCDKLLLGLSTELMR